MTTAAVGEPIWLLIPGEGNEERGIGPGGIHQAKVTAANDSEGTVDVKRDGDGAEFKGVSMSTPQRCKEWPDDVKEGDGIAIACDFESNFPENGFVDMTEMEKLNDAELARNLEKLYFRDQSYCWCGAALVAMNLMKKIDIYSHTQLDSYQSVVNPRVDLDPHVWGVAGSCYKKLFEKKIVESSMIGKSGSVLRNHQAIIITGESGAGKSFTTKKVLDFIAAAGQHRESSFDHMSNTRDSGTSVSLANTPEGKQSVTNRMLATTPILEAYGNAAMPRNNDSSRFGKLYKVYFHPGDQHITGCEIEPYLLEKSRVSSQQKGERNYHIFYRMLLGLEQSHKDELHLKNCRDYTYLKLGTSHLDEEAVPPTEATTGIPQGWGKFSDREGMKDSEAAFTMFFDEDYGKDAIRVTAGVLTLGNVIVEEDGAQGNCQINVEHTGSALEDAADLLQVDVQDLEDACTCFSRYSNKQWKVAKTSVTKAVKFRDAMARSIYSQLFDVLVAGCNTKLRTPEMNSDPSGDVFLGVLDIFGFEFVKEDVLCPSEGVVNSFEQFCINLCNEQLQKNFINVVFGFEEKMYVEELGPEVGKKLVANFVYESNDVTIDMMQKPITRSSATPSIFGMLDEESKKGKEDSEEADMAFYKSIEKYMHTIHARPKKGEHPPPAAERLLYAGKNYGKELRNPMGFRVKHYAGEVVYDCADWVDKNADKLSYDVFKCLGNSKDEVIIKPLFKEGFDAHAKGPVRAGRTVASAFRAQLAELAKTLSECECDFVRCIKTNRAKVANRFEADLVLMQLNYTGMLATLKVRKMGYAMRLPFEAFKERYHMLTPHANDTVDMLLEAITTTRGETYLKQLEATDKKKWQTIMKAKEDKDFIRKGNKGRILAREWFQMKLEEERRNRIADAAKEIQYVYVTHKAKRQYDHVKRCYLRIIPELHNYINKKRAKEEGEELRRKKEEAAKKMEEARQEAIRFAEAQAAAQAVSDKAKGIEVSDSEKITKEAIEKTVQQQLEQNTDYQAAANTVAGKDEPPEPTKTYTKEDPDATWTAFMGNDGEEIFQEDKAMGKLVYKAGSRKHRKEYIGQVDDLKYPDGKGKMQWERGTNYDGEWKCDKPHGNGVYKWPSGNQYTGEFRNGKKHGAGVFTTPDGNTYDGEWQFDNAHGHGVFDTPEGDKYEGEFSIDMKHGHGKMTFANQDVYDGAWDQDKRNGFGVFTTESGDCYEGQFMDDRLHGKGIMTSKDGYKFEGWYKDGKRDGDGEMTLPNGTKIQGKWVNDVRVDKKKRHHRPRKPPPEKTKANENVEPKTKDAMDNMAKTNSSEPEPTCGCVVS